MAALLLKRTVDVAMTHVGEGGNRRFRVTKAKVEKKEDVEEQAP